VCGICGIFGDGDKYKIFDMMLSLRHRGDNGRGSYIDDKVALGHQRLSIIDLSLNGNQPMINEDETVYLVVNGEIYNYIELRELLKSKGHIFKSNSDSEVILHSYEEYGERFVEKIRGMFAIALYDKKQSKLILVRDPIGKKPLYYYQDKDRLVFASEIKALFEANVSKEINYDLIPAYLIYQYTIGIETMFKGVHKLPAGHIMIINPDGFKERKYWTIKENINNQGESLRELLEESVKLRLRSDVPVGAFLSGGIDSSAIIALYRKYYQGDLHTFTATFKTKSESQYAKLVSKYLSTIYHEIEITSKMVQEDIKKITWHYDEPLGEAATINNYYLAKEAKHYVNVVLAGEGGDEIFGGYPWYHYAKLIPLMNSIPFKKFWCGSIWRYIQGDVTNKYYGLSRMALFLFQDGLYNLQLYPTTAMSTQNCKWLMNSVIKVNPILYKDIKNNYNQMLAMDCLNLLPEKFLMKADKGTMAFAIEERLPLLDKEIIQYAFSIDPKLKKDKYIFRKAVEDLLPSEIVWRKKQGFGTPITEWLSSDLKGMVVDRLSNGTLLKEICKKESLNKIVSYIKDDKLKKSNILSVSPANVIWNLFALQIWDDVWFGER
jgi:asparagine synthase (glutamine-hydrolysing)